MDILSLLGGIPAMVWTILTFVVALSIIVFVHEYGHYIVGRWCGIKAEVFSIGFGSVLFSRLDRYGTRWQIAALPFGGYVKFKGDANGASAKDIEAAQNLSVAEKRQTMHGAPLWARAATVAAGPLFNFIFAFLVFVIMALVSGAASNRPEVESVAPLPSQSNHLRPGDVVVAISGEETPDMTALFRVAEGLSSDAPVIYTVMREGQKVTFDGPHPFPALVGAVSPQGAAFEVGLQAGDVIQAIDGKMVQRFSQLRQIVGDSGGRNLNLTVWRDGKTFSLYLTPRRVDSFLPDGGFEKRWLIGLSGGFLFETPTRSLGLFEAFSMSMDRIVFIIETSLSGLWHMITGAISTCNLSGPIGIAESTAAAASLGAGNFVFFIGVLSVAIGLMNLFPIPVLDGGHLVFYAYEALVGSPPGDRFVGGLMSVGFAVLLVLMVFAVGNDLFCP